MPKTGAFRNWTEDEQAAEIVLPMTGISKNLIQFSLGSSESVAVTNKAMRSAQKLVVKNKMTGETLLLADPLAGLVDDIETTWTLNRDGDLCITLAKLQPAPGSAAAKEPPPMWGETLCAKGGKLECYKTVAEVTGARELREARERNRERERLERVEESHRLLREKSEKEAKARREAEAIAEAERAREEKKTRQTAASAANPLAGLTLSGALSKVLGQFVSGLPMIAIMLFAGWYRQGTE